MRVLRKSDRSRSRAGPRPLLQAPPYGVHTGPDLPAREQGKREKKRERRPAPSGRIQITMRRTVLLSPSPRKRYLTPPSRRCTESLRYDSTRRSPESARSMRDPSVDGETRK